MQTKVLAGRYRLERQLGKGGMGSVWLAEHLTLNSWVAVKLMDPAIASTTEGAERFKREAQAAASLRSAHVVQVLDYGVHEDTPFLVMELLQGQSLADCLERETRLAPERTLSIVTQIGRAIGRVHAGGIVHRDLKPDNIFLVREDDQELAKVLDFGIAKTTGLSLGSMETRTGVTMGTPYYMSPEQVEGKKALDHRSDLWSLTVIACECLTGVRPFDGETYGELLLNICARPVTPPSRHGFFLLGFDEWFAKGANRDPAQRFDSAQALVAALADVIMGRVRHVPLGAAPATSLEHASPATPVAMPGAGVALDSPRVAPATTGALEVGMRARPLAEEAPRRRGVRLAMLLGCAVALVALGVSALVLRKRPARETRPALLPEPSAAPARQGPPGPSGSNPEPAPGSSASANSTAPQSVSRKPASTAAVAVANPPSARSASGPSLPVPGPVGRASRCYSDPFTGQLRVAKADHASDSFPCRQNPFTGAYQR